MTLTRFATTSVLATLGALTFVAGIAWTLAGPAAWADGRDPWAGGDGSRAFAYGGSRGRHGGPCGRLGAGHLRGVAGFVSGRLDLDETQQAAFALLTDSLEQGRAQARAVCDEIDRTGPPADAPAALARMERFMEIGLETVRDARPSFDAFYGTLDAEQRATLDAWLARGPRGHGPRGPGRRDLGDG
jgi:hypothetical protein